MTKKELAEMLSGREYGMEIMPREERDAKDAGLVVVYGYSDDSVELRGAIDEEIGAFDGVSIHLNKDGVVWSPLVECDPDECPYLKKVLRESSSIQAVWHNKGNPCWSFETEIPHETFNIMEDGELFCVGIVFSMEDL